MKKLAFTLSFFILGLGISAFAKDVPTGAPAPSINDQIKQAREHISRKQWDKGISDLLSIVQSEPNNADAHNLLGYSYRLKMPPDLPLSFKHYKQALALNPNHLGAHEYIGQAYLMDNQPDEAIKHLKMIEQICGNKKCEEYVDLAHALDAYKNKPFHVETAW